MPRAPIAFRLAPMSLACLVLAAPPAHADVPNLVWGPVEVVDSPVSDVSSASGISIAYQGGVWHVVYAKAGVITLASRNGSGWLTPDPVSSGDYTARDPHLAMTDGALHVVWPEFRPPNGQVWARHRDGATWSALECLTCDRDDSTDPVVAGSGARAMALWAEDSLGHRQIRGRVFDGSWGPIEIASQSPVDASEPSISDLPYSSGFYAAWTDLRHGSSEIYVRPWNGFGGAGWASEQRATTLGGCVHPSIHAEFCCGDAIAPDWLVAFERALGGPSEVYVQGKDRDAIPLSAIDGVSSFAPSADGFAYCICFSLGGPVPRYWVTWTDDGATREHSLALLDYAGPEGTTPLASGLSTSAVGGTEGNPNAGVMAAWIENRGGVPTLVARRGQVPGATDVTPQPFPERIELSVSPNPVTQASTLRLRLPAPARVSLRVVDAAGRAVYDWGARELVAGTTDIAWSATDTHGARLRAGIYFAVASVGERRIERTLVVLR